MAARRHLRIPGTLRALVAFGILVALAPGLEARQAGPPPPLPERPIEFPEFEEFTLDNGMHVVVLSYGTQPVLSARLYMAGGRAEDPAGKQGVAQLTATVLTRGAGPLSAEEISEEIEGIGGTLAASAGQDFFSVSTTVPAVGQETAFRLLGEVLLRATFPESEVELARRQALSGLQAELGQPQAIATRRFNSAVYGMDHPYGVGPTPATVQAISRADLIEYRERVMTPDGALLMVSGLVDRDEIEALVRRHLGEWTGPRRTPETPPAPPQPAPTRIQLVHRPSSVQSVVVMGHLGVEPGNPDYFPLQVLNRVLGGGSDARLFRILREERGWTYGAFSQFTRPAQRGHFLAQAEVRPEVTDSTVVEMLAQIGRMGEESVPDDELDGAISFLAGSFPLRLEAADQIGGQIATTLLLGLPLEDITDYPARIRAVSGDDVRRVGTDHLHPDRMVIVVVGDATVLAERLEALYPVDFVDVDGSALSREEVLGAAAPASWNAEELRSGTRLYEAYLGTTPMGTAEYLLERDGPDWVSTITVTALGTAQETRLRFAAADLTPRALLQEANQGPLRTWADLEVVNGRLTGELELPLELGGSRSWDQRLEPGTLLAGMDEYALAVAPLAAGAHFSLPYLDLVGGEVVRLEVRVTGESEVVVPAGRFPTWRVEISGGELPMTLFLRQEAPHILIRQEYAGQPVRFDLVELTEL